MDHKATPTYSDTGTLVREIFSAGYRAVVLVDPVNRRLRVLNGQGPDWPGLARAVISTAQYHRLSKVLFYALEVAAPHLEETGYRLEGRIPRFFSGREAFCYSYFVEPVRSQSTYLDQEDRILAQARQHGAQSPPSLPEGYTVQPVPVDGAETLVELYRTVFSSYPSPLFDLAYVKRVMRSHVYFLAAYHRGNPVSAASVELDKDNLNAEMTDCATLPEHRGRGLLTVLLSRLEEETWRLNMGVLYSLSRAGSFGMNAALNKRGFTFKGRFINNCHIEGRFEDMNLWVKTRRQPVLN